MQQKDWQEAQPCEGPAGRGRGRGRGKGRGRARGRGRGDQVLKRPSAAGAVLKRPAAAPGRRSKKNSAEEAASHKKGNKRPPKEQTTTSEKKPRKSCKAKNNEEAAAAQTTRAKTQPAQEKAESEQATEDPKKTFARRYCPSSGPNRDKWLGLREVWEQHVAPQINTPSKYEDFLGPYEIIYKAFV